MASRFPSVPKLETNLGNPLDLPPYTVKVSDRAKYVRLSISVENGLEVVVPNNYDHRQIPKLIQQKQNWINRNQLRLNEREAFLQSQSPHALPTSIKLRSLDEEWKIEYHQTVTKFSSLTIQEITTEPYKLQLLVSGDIHDIAACKNLLKQWLMRKAEKHLFSWLRKISLQSNLPYRTTTIRSQKTLWGSCSSDRNISLNYKLLFLDPHVVEYVLIHELCHTVHMNHSIKFWELVRKFAPNYKPLDKSLNQAWKIIPAWLSSL